MSETRAVTMFARHMEQRIIVPHEATGQVIKQCAINQGFPMLPSWQLQGHNCNGSNRIIEDGDVPWHDTFTVVETYSNR